MTFPGCLHLGHTFAYVRCSQGPDCTRFAAPCTAALAMADPARGDVAGTVDWLASLVSPTDLVDDPDDVDWTAEGSSESSDGEEDWSSALAAGAAQEFPPSHNRQTYFGDALRTGQLPDLDCIPDLISDDSSDEEDSEEEDDFYAVPPPIQRVQCFLVAECCSQLLLVKLGYSPVVAQGG
eukprot:COSAG01_NODE_2956_length_6797_cov_9.378322_9_plen_180_part_00